MRRQDGQTAAEYMGMLLLVAALVAVLVPGLGSGVSGRIHHLVSCIGTGGCSAAGGGSPSGPLGTANPGPTPAPTTVAPPSGMPAAGAAAWTGQAANLPQGGSRPYVPPKNSHGKPKKVSTGRGSAKGYEDSDGNIWVWNPPGSAGAHGGPHWDVQHPDGSHTNVYPDGSIRGEDNFPNKSRGGSDDSGSSDGGKDNTAKIVGGTAAGVGAGAVIWWGAKLLSPACGPFAPVCAIAF